MKEKIASLFKTKRNIVIFAITIVAISVVYSLVTASSSKRLGSDLADQYVEFTKRVADAYFESGRSSDLLKNKLEDAAKQSGFTNKQLKQKYGDFYDEKNFFYQRFHFGIDYYDEGEEEKAMKLSQEFVKQFLEEMNEKQYELKSYFESKGDVLFFPVNTDMEAIYKRADEFSDLNIKFSLKFYVFRDYDVLRIELPMSVYVKDYAPMLVLIDCWVKYFDKRKFDDIKIGDGARI